MHIMNNKEEILKHLDFSGGSNSWFDGWHTHVDWEGEGNQDWESRKKFIDELVDFYYELQAKLRDYPNPYQLYIWILESDSAEDAIYIHTPNPNEDNFPISIVNVAGVEAKNKELKDYISRLGFDLIQDNNGGELQYYLFDKKVGVPLKEK